ncbi:MAG: hypothetical protein ABIG37_00135 [Nanoarchaeota archaeon]|nr:hypothetical protein [Nanoarchaeota archaeon]
MTKGEVTKFQFRPLTLDDKLAKDGIEAVGTLVGKEPCYIVGGMAGQSYLPTSCRRPTSDIDLSVVQPLNYASFKKFAEPVKEFLKDNHYHVKERKHSRAFKLEVENSEGNRERLLIEFSRRNERNFDISRKKLERELENAKSKILEERNSTYVVASPEDIVIPKLTRIINSMGRNKQLKRAIPNVKKPFSEEDIKKRLKLISELREGAMLEPTDLELAEKLRFVSDVYDIRILSELAGLNDKYFAKVCNDWNTILQKTPERDLLFESILPDFVINLKNNVDCNR